KAIAYEVISSDEAGVKVSGVGRSVFGVDIGSLHPKETAYIYVQADSPVFRKITVSSEDVTGVLQYTYQDYLNETKSGRRNSTFVGFLLFLLAGFLLVMTIYLTVALIHVLNRWLK